MWSTVKGFSVVNEAEVDVFLEFLCFFYDPMGVRNLISGSSAFSKSSLYTWNFSVHVLLKPHLKDFEHYLAGMWNEHNCVVVKTFFGIALLWDWNENWPFPVQQTTSHFFITLFLNDNKTKNNNSKSISQKALSKKGMVRISKIPILHKTRALAKRKKNVCIRYNNFCHQHKGFSVT